MVAGGILCPRDSTHVPEPAAGGGGVPFALRDATAAVASAYGATALADGTFELRHPQNQILSIHRADGVYPSCAEKPRTGETTVVVVSHFYRVEAAGFVTAF